VRTLDPHRLTGRKDECSLRISIPYRQQLRGSTKSIVYASIERTFENTVMSILTKCSLQMAS
jgi:hypothetical protein